MALPLHLATPRAHFLAAQGLHTVHRMEPSQQRVVVALHMAIVLRHQLYSCFIVLIMKRSSSDRKKTLPDLPGEASSRRALQVQAVNA